MAREVADDICTELHCHDTETARRPVRQVYDCVRRWIRNAAEQRRRAELLRLAADTADNAELSEFGQATQDFAALSQLAGTTTQPRPASKPAPKRSTKADPKQPAISHFFKKAP